jgi:hypothetical protein
MAGHGPAHLYGGRRVLTGFVDSALREIDRIKRVSLGQIGVHGRLASVELVLTSPPR